MEVSKAGQRTSVFEVQEYPIEEVQINFDNFLNNVLKERSNHDIRNIIPKRDDMDLTENYN